MRALHVFLVWASQGLQEEHRVSALFYCPKAREPDGQDPGHGEVKMQDIIKQLDAEIQRKQPKGILISIPLFNALRDLERIADQQLVFPGTSIPVFTYPMLDKKVFVTTAFLNDGEYYRLPT